MSYNSFRNDNAGDSQPALLRFQRTNNFGSVAVNNLLGEILWEGFDATVPPGVFKSASYIQCKALGAPAGNVPSELQFNTSYGAGTQLAMNIGQYGQVTIADPATNQATLVVENNQSTPNINLRTANATASNAPHVHFTRSHAGAGDVVANDDLGRLEFFGFQGGTAREAGEITAVAESVNGTNAVSSYLSFRTVPTSYAASAERMRISANGNVTISAPVSGTALTIVAGGETITAGDLTITSGNVYLPNTTSTPLGVVFQGGNRFIHSFGADGCTYIGQNAGSVAASNTSNNTTAVGRNCLTAITTGNGNTAVGDSALGVCTTQSNNTAMGTRALQQSTGNNNTAIGFRASEGAVGSTAIRNTLLGSTCGPSISSGGENVYIGFFTALSATTSAQNVVVGSQAFITATTSANNNVVIGFKAGHLSTGFSQNTIVGTVALDKNTTGTYNLALGYGSGTNYTGTESHNILLHSDGVLGDNNTLRIGQSTGTGTRQIQNTFIQGYVNLPGTPCFHAYIGTAQNNVTGDGTNYDVIFQTERYDISSSYNAATGVFTAPVTGKYIFTSQLIIEGITAGMNNGSYGFLVNSFSYNGGVTYCNPVGSAASGTLFSIQNTAIFSCTAGDTVQCRVNVNGGAKVCDFTAQTASFFAGQLLS